MLDGGMILGFIAILGIYIFIMFVGWLRGPVYGPGRGRNGRLSPRFIHSGSPTDLTFTDDGKIVDKNGKELKTIPFKEWVREIKK